VSSEGIDFVMKKGSGTCDALALGKPVSILHLQGRYLPGETAEQWRGEGVCERMPLEGLLDRLPHYTVTSMVASKRIELEKGSAVHELHEGVSDVRCSHYFLISFLVTSLNSCSRSICLMFHFIPCNISRIDWRWRTKAIQQKSIKKLELSWKMEIFLLERLMPLSE
jgi:hypothetical protein